MTPQEAIIKLRAAGWPMADIAKAIGMSRQNIYKAYHAKHVPHYNHAVALIEMAKRGKKPPARKK